MAGLPYDPMTPSVEDYQRAQKESEQASQHYAYVNKQSNDKAEIAKARKEMEAAGDKQGSIMNALRKAGKLK